MQNTGMKKNVVWIASVLLGALIVTGCGSAKTREDNPTLLAPKLSLTKIESTILVPNAAEPVTATPNTLSSTATRTPSQNKTSEASFIVCENKQEEIASQETPSSQSGLSMELDSLIPPAPPAKVELSDSEGGVVVTWQGTGTDVDKFYNIYQRVAGDKCWVHIGAVPIEGENIGWYELYAILTSKANTHSYAVTTVDIYGNESALSTITTTAGP